MFSQYEKPAKFVEINYSYVVRIKIHNSRITDFSKGNHLFNGKNVEKKKKSRECTSV